MDLLSAKGVPVSSSWQPPGPGKWSLTLNLYLPEGQVVTQSQDVVVRAAHPVSWRTSIKGAWPRNSTLSYVGLLAGLIGFALGGGAFVSLRRRSDV